ncbi:hypothetical protein C2R22_21320 (plasmid) [Salinigranum rubrum]|uniref:Uncharacterized protein n=1 Tax=Salinigranum rubrum TaxID=755307 RepID=A0A2I8VQE0_9EURY|nr:hypothetical protein [Salinigranum rubrum]AUV84125.1 hypothetical protein C2R22_21320 [Salinigranum rubrum]
MSVFTSQPVVRLLSSAELPEVGITLLIIALSTSNDGVIGVQLSWVFLGYLVYALVPKLYPKEMQRLSVTVGFRALTAVLTVYFGLALTVGLGLSPSQVAFGLVESGVVLGNFWRGVIVGTLAFSIYLSVLRDEHLFDEESVVFRAYLTFDTFSDEAIASEKRTLRAARELPDHVRRIVLSLYDIPSGVIFVGPCFGVGIVIGVLNTYYPVPEALFLFGVVVSFIPTGGRITRVRTNLESRLVDNTVNSIRNFKGMLMVVVSGLGLGFCAYVLIGNLGLTTDTVGNLLEIISGQGFDHPSDEAGWTVARSAALSAVLLTPFVYSLIGLLYWSRQFSRIPTFAEYWESETYDLPPPDVPSSLATRPRGGLLFANSLLLLASVFVWQFFDESASLLVLVGFDVVWFFLLFLVLQSVRYSFHGDPQPIESDGEVVFLAAIGQAISIAFAEGLLKGYFSDILGSYPDDVELVVAVMVGLLLMMIIMLANVWEMPDRLAERTHEGQTESEESLWALVGICVVLFFVFYAAAVVGLASSLDVGIYLLVVAYVLLLWYIESHVIPDSAGDDVDA